MTKQLTRVWAKIGLTILTFVLTSCNSFDKEVALTEFKELKAGCVITEMTDYECDGTMGECWYVEFKYQDENGDKRDTTLQYWRKERKWLTKREFQKTLK